MPQRELEQAFKKINSKSEMYTNYWSYYDSDHPLIYSTERLRQVFNNLDGTKRARFVENWVAVVVNAAQEKINLLRFNVAGDEQLTGWLNSVWAMTELNLDAIDAHLAALVCGEAFVVIWPNEDGSIAAYYNDPRMCHVEYDDDNPRVKLWAAKRFISDHSTHVTIYYPDRIEYWQAGGKAESANKFKLASESANPYGIVPVFHLRRERRTIKSELEDILTIQDGLNKIFSDLMVASEFAALKQRVIISQFGFDESLRNAPNMVWTLAAGDGVGQNTEVAEFSASDLNQFLMTMDRMSLSIAKISRTPKHYFFSQSGDPSGEALIAMEAPLNTKVQMYIQRFKPTWRKIAQFILSLGGYSVELLDIEPIFDEPETIQPYTRALIRKTNTDAGLPLITTLRREGWTEQELEQITEDQDDAQRRQTNTLARALAANTANLNAGNQTNGLERDLEPQEDDE